MAELQDVANFFIQLANADDNGDGMTNLRLQQYLYFAQGEHLAKTGEPLFKEKIKAWEFGPVVPPIYNKYKKYGRNIIDSSDIFYDSEVFTNHSQG